MAKTGHDSATDPKALLGQTRGAKHGGKRREGPECLIVRCACDVLAHGKVGSCPPILSTQSDGP